LPVIPQFAPETPKARSTFEDRRLQSGIVMATFTLPVPWRGESEQGLSGVMEIYSCEFAIEGITDPRVGDLIAILNKKLRRMSSETVVGFNLLFHGVKVSSDALLEYLVPELMCSSPRLVMATLRCRGPHRMTLLTLFVNTPSGKHISVRCSSMATVADVKTRIEAKVGTTCKEQRLMYGSKQLQDHQTLPAYNIGHMATLHLSSRLLGGSPGELTPRTFADVSDGSIITAIAFSPDAPEWRVCSKGLNIEGRCPNPACCAFRRMIIDRKGFKPFNVSRDGNVKCPICRRDVEPVTCGLYDCSWRYEGVKKNDELSISSQWRDARGYVYHRFNADENNGSVEWLSLVLVAKPRTGPEDELCSVCHSPLASPANAATATSRCGHTFHRACFKMWTEHCEETGIQPSCAICHRSM